jgi:ribosomal-protein-alanine N-acetyltransferase
LCLSIKTEPAEGTGPGGEDQCGHKERVGLLETHQKICRNERQSKMTVLRTSRLTLFPLSRHQLQQYLDDPAALEKEIGNPVSRELITDWVRRAIGMKLAKMAAAPESRHAWYTYWLIDIPDLPFGAGLAGFKGFPDECGESEIGYGIDPAFQGKGYMTEAVRALIAWAFQEPACGSVVARGVKKWNIASQKVLTKSGMAVYEETGEGLNLRISRAAPVSG